MPDLPNHRVRVHFICRRGHEPHILCVPVGRGVPPQLRCDEPQGYGPGGGGCPMPPDLETRVQRELDHSLETWKRQGYVVIREH